MINDTIAAIATSLSTSGIGIIRISGDDSFQIVHKIFKPHHENKKLEQQKSHTIHYGHIIYKGEMVDEVLVSIMKAPHTFTREDIVEINCHGGIVVMQKILGIVLSQGARLAEPGEFTKRAFLNGRIDLSQAEAVIDLINAKTDLSLKSSVSQLEGSLTHRIKPIRRDLLEIIAHIEASIDYPEYDIEELNSDYLIHKIRKIKDAFYKLYETAEHGKILREGVKTAIIGKPNVGKSSLMNALLKEERAIVTEVPGTTRDTLEEFINIGGIPLKIIDTAGIRETNDLVEKIGVEKSKAYLKDADLIILMLDVSQSLDLKDREILESIRDKKAIIVLNKIDLDESLELEDIKKISNWPIIKVSIKNRSGLDHFEEIIRNLYFQGNINFNDQVYVTNVRHKNALERAINSLDAVIETIHMGLPEDCLAIDLKNAYEASGEIIGDALGENIIDQIFSQFCLGK
jgi:tRNA modification GTPase